MIGETWTDVVSSLARLGNHFPMEAAWSLIQGLSKSWQNTFCSDFCGAKGIKSRPNCCLRLAGRIFCIRIGSVWRFLAAVFVVASACPVPGSCVVKTGMQNTGKTDDCFCSINNLMEMKCTFRLSGISDCKHQSDDDERKLVWKFWNILKCQILTRRLGHFEAFN